MANTTKNPKDGRRRVRWWQAAILLAAGAVTVAGFMVLLAGRPPKALTQIQTKIAQVPHHSRTERARAFEQALVSEITAPFPGESSAFGSAGGSAGGVSRRQEPDGTVSLGLDILDMNLWLQERLEPWMANQGKPLPAALDGWITATDQTLSLMASDPALLDGRPITVELQPVLDDAGRLHLNLRGARIGRLPLPDTVVAERIQQLDDIVSDLLAGEGINPTWAIDQRRTRRLVGIKMTPTQLWIRLKAAPPGTP